MASEITIAETFPAEPFECETVIKFSDGTAWKYINGTWLPFTGE